MPAKARAAKKKPAKPRTRPVVAPAPAPVLIPGTNIRLVDARMGALLEPIASLVPDPANPRRAKDIHALVAMLRRFGYSDPIVANRETRVIEAGHMRLAAVTEAGGTEIPVLWTDHGRIDAAAFNIGHNRSNEIVAEWDDDALRKLIGALRDEDATAVEAIGFDDAELERLLGEFSADEAPFPDLNAGTTSDLKLRTFTVSAKQLAIIERAVSEAKTRGQSWNPDGNNANTNANAITAICGLYLGLDIHADYEHDGDG
jgi:hypothetical protein